MGKLGQERYKKIKPRLETIDEFISYCGLFTSETELNGGYGCKSKSVDKQEPGKCYAWDCPLAYVANLDDFKKHDKILYDEYKDDECENTLWILIHSEIKGVKK
jgi:hypothetical protein